MRDAKLVQRINIGLQALKLGPCGLEGRVDPFAPRSAMPIGDLGGARSILPSRRHRLVAFSCSD